MKLNVSDTVRMIPPSYCALAKGDYHYPPYLHRACGSEDTEIMLGGEYRIIEKSGDYARLLTNNWNHKGMALVQHLCKAENFLPSKLQYGDRVMFEPKCNQTDIAFLTRAIKVIEYGEKYTVASVLNDYYIFLDSGNKGEPIAFPFRWIDFKKA